jgi:hypothetical protein
VRIRRCELGVFAVAVFDPDPEDPRLTAIGIDPAAWADAGMLTIAVRHRAEAPPVPGTVHERSDRPGLAVGRLR